MKEGLASYGFATSTRILKVPAALFSPFFLPTAKLDGVKTYMRLRRVPTNIQNKVIKWFDYLWFTQKSSDEEKSISCLPGKGARIITYFPDCREYSPTIFQTS